MVEEPTASQAWAEEHDNASRLAKAEPEGAGTGSAVQDVPSQTAPPLAPAEPTAAQKLAETHDTEPTEPGIACALQAVPFHISAKAGLPPTASQKAADAQETVPRVEIPWPAGPGTDCTCQDVPFQVSASGTSPAPVLKDPTASQNVADVHETPESPADVDPAGLGTDWSVQEVPSQASASMIPVGPSL